MGFIKKIKGYVPYFAPASITNRSLEFYESLEYNTFSVVIRSLLQAKNYDRPLQQAGRNIG